MIVSDTPEKIPAVLAFDDLHVWFENSGKAAHVVKGVTLSLAAGERLGLVGESGCGKTTTILAAMGLLPATARLQGEIRFNGKNILSHGERSVAPHRWKNIAMVFQGAMNALNPVKTIGWQIAEAIQAHTSSRGSATNRRVNDLLDLVGIPAAYAGRYPHEFSGGMRQRAIIAMALSCEPLVLLADEPTTALDVMVQDQILQLLVRLSRELHLALILVTHDLGVVASICQRSAVMLDGQIIEQGSVQDIYRQPAHPYTCQLFAATPTLRQDAQKKRPALAAPKPLLDVTDLSVFFPREQKLNKIIGKQTALPFIAVDKVSLAVGYGELVALVGQSGSGKTTTLQAILGMVHAGAGSITVNNTETTKLSSRAWRPLRRHVQMIYQDPYESLNSRYRVKDIIEEPLLIHGAGGTAQERHGMVLEALEQVALLPAKRFLYRYPHELSGGQRQRVAIAASIVLKPDLLLADEPVSMLDVSVRAGVLTLLDTLRRTGRMGVLMITHDLSTAARYADRIIVMHEGKIVEQGPSAAVILSPQADYTKALLSCIPDADRWRVERVSP